MPRWLPALPTPEQLREHPVLALFARWLGHPALWRLDRRSASRAAFWGVLCACLPMPFQMIPASLGAILTQAHLPLSVALVWLNNPFTLLPLLYAGCWLGDRLLGVPVLSMDTLTAVWQHWQGQGDVGVSVGDVLAQQWQPLLLGSLVMGLAAGALAAALVRLCWRETPV